MQTDSTPQPVMTMGKFRGQPLNEMTTPYLLWLLSQDAIRYRYCNLMRQAMDVLRDRFLDFDALVEELTPKAPTPEYWKLTPNHSAIRKQRAKDRQRRNVPSPRPLPTEQPADVLMDGSYWVRNARLERASAPINTNVDDLL